MKRHVSATLDIEVTDATSLEFKIAVARTPGSELSESLTFTLDGNRMEAREMVAEHGTRVHLLDSEPGSLHVEYSASVAGKADSPPVTDYDLSKYLRPSRYAEADKFFGFTGGEFNLSKPHPELLQDITTWVGSRLLYQAGSSRSTDSAVDTMLSGAGVCRDFAHLTVALLRAVTIPARLVAVYAPGCDPMTSMLSSRRSSITNGVWSTRPDWLRVRHSCGSQRVATPRTRHSWTITEGRSRSRTPW